MSKMINVSGLEEKQIRMLIRALCALQEGAIEKGDALSDIWMEDVADQALYFCNIERVIKGEDFA